MDEHRLRRGLLAERREDGGKALRKHRLPRPGRSDHEEAVSSSRRDDQRPLGEFLIDDIGVVEFLDVPVLMSSPRLRWLGAESTKPGEALAQLREGRDSEVRLTIAGRQEGLRGGHEAESLVARRDGIGHHATDGVDRTIERELPDEEVIAGHGRVDLPRRHEDGDGDGQVESRSALLHLPGGEVDRDVQARNREPARPHRAPHARARLEDGGVGHANDAEPGYAPGRTDLDDHGNGLDAPDRCRGDRGAPARRHCRPS